jgi:hypothetical protein
MKNLESNRILRNLRVTPMITLTATGQMVVLDKEMMLVMKLKQCVNFCLAGLPMPAIEMHLPALLIGLGGVA